MEIFGFDLDGGPTGTR